MSLLYGILFTFCMYQNPNGITFPILIFLTIMFAVQYVKKIGFPIKKDIWIYGAGMVLLGISSFLTASGFLVFFNLIGIILLFVVMMIHQFYQDKEWNFQTHFKNLFILFGTSISCIPYPFQHGAGKLTEKSTEKKKTVFYILAGVGISILLLLVILPLLIRSDRIFEMYFGNFIKHIHFGNLFWMFVMTVVITIICYAFFSGLCRYNLKMNTEQKKNHCNPIIGITFTSILAVIYIVYSCIQIIFLFIGLHKGVLRASTYSSYARSGFWELILVSLINFVMVLLCIYLFEDNKILKFILTVISMCTFIMIFQQHIV